MLRTFGLGLILLFVVLLSVWWVSSDPSVDLSVPQNDPVTDYYLREVSMTRLRAAGQPRQVLQTAEIRQLVGVAGTQLRQPTLTLHPLTGPPWRMVADSGWLDATGETLSLSGAVQLSRAASATTVPLQLQTAALQIQLPQRYLETTEPVQINSGWQQIQAIGLRAWLQAPVRLEFLREVKGTYVPENQ